MQRNSSKLFSISMLALIVLISISSIMAGCDKREVATPNVAAKVAKSCKLILGYTLKEFPVEDTTDAKLLAMVANDYREIQVMLRYAKICARNNLLSSKLLNGKANTLGIIYATPYQAPAVITNFPTGGKANITSTFLLKLHNQVSYIRRVSNDYVAVSNR